jgi:hypothetical protein
LHNNDIPVNIQIVESYGEDREIIINENKDIVENDESKSLHSEKQNTSSLETDHIPGPYRHLKNLMDTILLQQTFESKTNSQNQSLFSSLFSSREETETPSEQNQVNSNATDKPLPVEISENHHFNKYTNEDIAHQYHIRIVHKKNPELDIIELLKHTKLYYFYRRKDRSLWV